MELFINYNSLMNITVYQVLFTTVRITQLVSNKQQWM